MMIKRFTLTNLIVNLILWSMFVGTIALAEYFDKKRLIRYLLFRDLLVYDLFLSSLLLLSIILIGTLLRSQIKSLMNGNSIKFIN